MSFEIDFSDLTVIEIPVNISGEKYFLREASGEAACNYRNAVLKCTKLGPEGKPSSMEGIASVEPLLVSLCLVDSEGKRVPESLVKSWPSRVVKVLYDKAKEISELDDDTDEDEDKASGKNS